MIEKNTQRYLITIIIPVYNRMEYIQKAIQSVVDLGRSDIELLIIDDASTDSTVDVCQRYTELNAYVKIFSLRENSGPGIARNKGLEKARGEWIAFLDSDDYLEKEGFLSLICSLESSSTTSVVAYGAIELSGNGSTRELPSGVTSITKKQSAEYLKNYEVGYVWQYCFQRSFLEENSIKFSNLYFCEDIAFVYSALLHTDVITILPLLVLTHVVGCDLSLGDTHRQGFMNKDANPLAECCQAVVSHISKVKDVAKQKEMMKKFATSRFGQIFTFFGLRETSVLKTEYQKFKEVIQEVSNNFSKPLYVAPAGIGSAFAGKLFMAQENVEIAGFCDNNNISLKDFPVISLKEPFEGDRSVLLISLNSSTLDSLEKQFHECGLKTHYTNNFMRVLS